MPILVMLIVGLAVGVVGNWMLPRHSQAGMLSTMIFAFLGSFTFGFLGVALGLYPTIASLAGVVMSTVGALLLVGVYALVMRSAVSRHPRTPV